MKKDIYNLRKVNPNLIKSLQGYIFIVTTIILLILFASQLYKLDSYKYYSKMDNKLMLSDSGDIDQDEFDVLNMQLDDFNNKLRLQGVDVNRSEVIINTSIELYQSYYESQHSAIIATDATYLNSLTTNLTWLFKEELASNGIYISRIDYERLNNATKLEISIFGSLERLEVVINGVYEILPTKYLFYSDNDFVNDYIIVSSMLFKNIVTSRTYSSYTIIETSHPITVDDLSNLEIYFDNTSTAIQNYNNSIYLIESLLNRLNELIWVIFISIVILTFIMMYHYFVEIRYVINIYALFYLDDYKLFLLNFLSSGKILLKPFLIPITFFSLAFTYIYAEYGYLLTDLFYIAHILLVFVIYIFILSIHNSTKVAKY